MSTTDPKEPTAEKKRPQHMVFLRPNLLKRSCIIKMGGGGTCLTLGGALVKVVGNDLKCGEFTKNQPKRYDEIQKKGALFSKVPFTLQTQAIFWNLRQWNSSPRICSKLGHSVYFCMNFLTIKISVLNWVNIAKRKAAFRSGPYFNNWALDHWRLT